jgi:hypothetical protein
VSGEKKTPDVGADYMALQTGTKPPDEINLKPGDDKPPVDGDVKKAEDDKSGALDMSKVFDGKYKDLVAANLAWTEQERTLGRVTTEAKEAQTKLAEMTELMTSLQETAAGDPKAFMDKLRASNIKVSDDKIVMPNFEFPEDFDPDTAKVLTGFMKTVLAANNQNQERILKAAIAPFASAQEEKKVSDLVPFAGDPAFKPALDNASTDIAQGRVSKGELAAALAVVRHLGDVPAMMKKIDEAKEIEKAKDGALPDGGKKPGDSDKPDDALTGRTYIDRMAGQRR